MTTEANSGDQNTYLQLRDESGRQFVLYGHDDSWCAVYHTDERHDDQQPADLDEWETPIQALQNIQEPCGLKPLSASEQRDESRKWCDSSLPVDMGNDAGMRFDRVLYCNAWRNTSKAAGGFEAIFEVARVDNGLKGFARWAYEYEKRDVVNNVLEANVEGFEGLFDIEGPDAWLSVHVEPGIYGDPQELSFPYRIYGDE